tara:strand:+ start:572 stop:1057 length:486 start_codon:yes stop_codon:yes gene_type:complete
VNYISEFKNKKLIKLVIFDFDGVFTDNKVIVDQNGNESVICSRYDGYGIEKLRNHSIYQYVISSEVKPIANERCKKLGIDCINNVKSKVIEAEKIIQQLSIKFENVCFIGNDINDIDLLDIVGFPVKTYDSHPKLNDRGYFSTKVKGGYGCVRELSDFLTS